MSTINPKAQSRDHGISGTTPSISELIFSHIQIGVCVILEDGTLADVRSRFMEEILPGIETPHAKFLDLIKEKTAISQQDYSALESALFMVMGENSVCFDLNKDTLPRHIKIPSGPDKVRILETTWTPIVEGDLINSILLTFNDISKSTALRDESQQNAQEIAVLNEIMITESTALDNFLKSAANYLGKIKGRVKNENAPLNPEDLAYVRRIAHTIKGNARSAKLLKMSGWIHEIEEKNSRVDAEIYLREFLEPIKQSLSLYIQWQEKIIQRAVDAITEDQAPAKTIGRLFSEVINENVGLANEFGIKNFRGRVVSFSNMQLEPVVWSCVKDAMTHVIRNTIDHGLKGYKESTEITLNVKVHDRGLTLVYEDHGHGINLKKISELANRFGASESRTNIDLARMIFADGVSTCARVTQISGRGVGMAAARDLIGIAGGTIDVDLIHEKTNSNWSFRLLIDIPT